jgi:hypothetical protein
MPLGVERALWRGWAMQETTYKGHLIKYHRNGGRWVAVVWGPDAGMAAGGQVVTGRADQGPEALLRRVRARIDRETAKRSIQDNPLRAPVSGLTVAGVSVPR